MWQSIAINAFIRNALRGNNTKEMTMGKSAARVKTHPGSDTVRHFVGSKIRELRGAMPTDDFARKSGVHPGRILEWEAGDPPSLSILEAMARRHNVGPGFFFPDGEVDPNYPEF